MGKKMFSLRLDTDLIDRLRSQAQMAGTTMTALITSKLDSRARPKGDPIVSPEDCPHIAVRDGWCLDCMTQR